MATPFRRVDMKHDLFATLIDVFVACALEHATAHSSIHHTATFLYTSIAGVGRGLLLPTLAGRHGNERCKTTPRRKIPVALPIR